MRGSTLAVIMAAVLSACTTSQMAYEKVAGEYVGQPADRFFIQHGPAYASQRLDNGSTIYSWSSGRIVYSVPGTATTTGTVNSYGGYSATTTYTPSSDLPVECQLNIVADSKGMITSVRIALDTIGEWEMSRCNEIFS